MADALEEMRSLGTFDEEELAELSEELLEKGEEEAQELPTGAFPEDVQPLGTWWSGNHFRIKSGIWYWEDQKGSQCGRKRTWKYKPSPGASHKRERKCPQGYY